MDAPTAKVCCVAMRGMSYEKSIYTIPCIGKLVINTCSITTQAEGEMFVKSRTQAS